ncbi:hypothetical protein OIU79_023399, partial [Salix purpurea]
MRMRQRVVDSKGRPIFLWSSGLGFLGLCFLEDRKRACLWEGNLGLDLDGKLRHS